MTKEIRPEWYKNLQTGPHRKKTFTAENITQIERKVSRSKKQDKRKRWLPITALSATAVVLLLGITLNLDRFTSPSPDDGNAGPGITDPGEPPVGTNDPTEPPPDDQTPGPDIAPLGEETLVELASLDQVMLSEALPFSLDEVNEVSVRTADNEEITIVEEGPNNLVTFLGQVSLSQSTVDEEQSADQPQLDTMLRFETGDALYAIPYASQYPGSGPGIGLCRQHHGQTAARDALSRLRNRPVRNCP
ncbi:hypothetical protein [Paenibacillus sp. 1P07SE]|uniref:hypothetical protein n=1 Tax=Paenibacillus sp. 1P07SE TaxID=3132209 RepID=UPI0039A483C4